MGARLADRLILIAAASVVVGASYAMTSALAAEPWVRFALRLEAASAPLAMSDPVRRQLAARLDEQKANTCAFDVPRSHVTVALELVRRTALPGIPRTEREDAERSAEAAVRHALRCNAADGNLWFLLALLHYRASADWSLAQPFLSASIALSPFEGDLLLKRARLVAFAARRPQTALDADVEGDLRHAVADLEIDTAAALLAALRGSGRDALADRLVASLPAERRAGLAHGAAAGRSTFGRAERYRHFEYRP